MALVMLVLLYGCKAIPAAGLTIFFEGFLALHCRPKGCDISAPVCTVKRLRHLGNCQINCGSNGAIIEVSRSPEVFRARPSFYSSHRGISIIIIDTEQIPAL